MQKFREDFAKQNANKLAAMNIHEMILQIQLQNELQSSQTTLSNGLA